MTSPVALPESFYLPSARIVAPRLLGHWLLRKTAEGLCGGPIVETEAYLHGDPASHSRPGLTPRNAIMFGPPGRAYVYFIYGAHFCVNVVCQPPGMPEAVLIRAIEPAIGLEQIRTHRSSLRPEDLTNGPAKLCEALSIDRQLDGVNLTDPHAPLFIAHNPAWAGFRRKRRPLEVTTRIGLTRAAHLPLRFLLAGSPYILKRSRSPTERRPTA
jgi:DNA-3-methyladenine glycosylase